MKNVPIVMIINQDVIAPFAVAVKSIAYSANYPVEIKVLATDLKDDMKSLVLQLSEFKAGVSLIDVASYLPHIDKFKDTHPNVNYNALLKFFIPEILKEYNKVLYLDVDIIVRRDLRALMEMSVGDNYAAVVKNMVKSTLLKKDIIHKQGSFNSGVMLLNCKKMREDCICEKLMSVKDKLTNDRYMDQTAFNAVMRKSVCYLPIKYNYIPIFDLHSLKEINHYFQTDYASRKELDNDMVILHLAGRYKPWKYSDGYYSKLWMTLYNKTDVSKAIDICYSTVKDENKTIGPVKVSHWRQFRILYCFNKIICIVYKDGLKIKTKFFKKAECYISYIKDMDEKYLFKENYQSGEIPGFEFLR